MVVARVEDAGGAEVRVAERLRRLRDDKGLTLRQLAARVGLSEAYLSRVENHKAAITIAGLERLARGLGVAMAAFFENGDSAPLLTVCRAGAGRPVRLRGARGFLSYMLAAQKAGKLMEPLVADVGRAARPMPLKAHGGEEFDYILEGECEFQYGKQRLQLRTGDAVYYDATVPHAARAVRGQPCRILGVVASREYLFHGDLTRLMNAGGA